MKIKIVRKICINQKTERIIKIPIVISENKYTVSNKVSTIACIIKILST